MPKISEALETLGIEKKDFKSIYEKVLKKEFNSKVSTISEKNLEEIKKEVKSDKKSKKWESVLKSDELQSFWWWFLSWLWFSEKKEEKEDRYEEEKDEEESIVLERPKKEESKRIPMSFDTIQPQKNRPNISLSQDKKPEIKTPFNNRPQQTNRPIQNSRPQQTNRPQSSKPPQHWWMQNKWFSNKPNFSHAPQHWGQQHHNNQHNNLNNRNTNNQQRTFTQPNNNFRNAQTPVQTRIQKTATTSENLVKKIEIIIDEKITVKEFSEKMWVSLPEVMKKLIENKIMTGLTASLDFDTASLIASEFWIIVKHKETKLDVETVMTWDLQSILDLDKDAEHVETRAPIVTIMWHVDHWKTSLLDYLRKTSVAEWEAGGITQWIWASVVNYNDKKICFIDTPGHELFTSLRARWAKLTNIAVIVIAADDSVMPQTIESIWHAKAAWVPIIIAITKIDKPWQNIDQIKSDIAKHWLTAEDRWWDVPVIWISSKTWQWIPDLLEHILLQAEMLDLKYNPNRSAVWVLLDAYKDPKQWIVSTIIVMTWKLKVWDILLAYNTYGKIRRIQNRKWQNVTEATGWDPVQILWITDLPEPGRIVEVVKNEKMAQEKMTLIQENSRSHWPESVIQQFMTELKQWNKESELRLILKADGPSSIEALKQAVAKIEMPKNVTIKIVHSDVWYFWEADLALAQASKAILIWYNITINSILKRKSESLKIEIKNFDIIYELTDFIKNIVTWMIEIEKEEVVVWKLEVLWIFYRKGKDMTIWWKVISGKAKNKLKFRVLRWEEILCNWDIVSLHRNKDEVKEVGEWEECGIKITAWKKIEEKDIIEFLEMQEIKD